MTEEPGERGAGRPRPPPRQPQLQTHRDQERVPDTSGDTELGHRHDHLPQDGVPGPLRQGIELNFDIKAFGNKLPPPKIGMLVHLLSALATIC